MRHQPRRPPPLAKVRPGGPAPAMGPGTVGLGGRLLQLEPGVQSWSGGSRRAWKPRGCGKFSWQSGRGAGERRRGMLGLIPTGG